MKTRVAFDDANACDRYMGRWSRAIGEKFLTCLDPPARRSWLDVGCGPGAFIGVIFTQARPSRSSGSIHRRRKSRTRRAR